jgi:hypothetical protein
MPGRRVSHSEARWALLPPTVIRCNATRPNGSRCKREAEDGAVVCDQHGGAAPQVRRRAAERLIMSADHVSDPKNWEENPPRPAIEDRVIDRPDPDEPEEIVEADIVEPEAEPANDTPPQIAEMIKSGAFDRKPGQ